MKFSRIFLKECIVNIKPSVESMLLFDILFCILKVNAQFLKNGGKMRNLQSFMLSEPHLALLTTPPNFVLRLGQTPCFSCALVCNSQRQSVFRSSFCLVLLGRPSYIWGSRKARFPAAFFFLFCLDVQPFSMIFFCQERLFHILDIQPFIFPPTFMLTMVSYDDK